MTQKQVNARQKGIVHESYSLLLLVCVPLYRGNVMYTASIHFNQEYVCMPGLSASNWYALTIELFCLQVCLEL